MHHRYLAAVWLLLFIPTIGVAVPPAADRPAPEPPKIAAASEEGQQAIAGFTVPDGIVCELFAAEPQLANPVAFCIDNRGRFYVCESFRQGRGVTDNRRHDRQWVDADLAAQSVEDREAYHRRLLGDKVSEYTRYDDQVRILEDRDGDGKADFSKVFARGFNAIVDGSAAGVLAHDGDVFLTCIPHLWRLRDNDGDAVADQRDSLHYGYGVRVAFRGHDSHGLIVGPDGRLYFSIGDRGYNIRSGGKHHFDPASGAVFRCELDGSDLEVVATGLRNPQELAFDEYGNLFTGDNNSDSGDKARWVYVVPGGDTGWRMYYQYLRDRGPFNQEKIWHPWNPEITPAYTVPPIANLGDGPSGLAYYPGTGLSDDFQGRFLLCDFRGGPANSGIRSFSVQPDGAFFQLADSQRPIWSILATDIAFAPDGSLYATDWVNGWEGLGKGRVYRFRSEQGQSELAQEVQAFLAADIARTPAAELASLLGHVDQRVRYKAQFSLAERGAMAELAQAAASADTRLGRLHGIWGLGQAARTNPDLSSAWKRIAKLTEDADPEIRAQACRTLRDAPGNQVSTERIVALLRDESPRVRYLAGLLAGAHGDAACLGAVQAMLSSNADQDPIVRHGGIMALTGAAAAKTLASYVKHPSRSVRIAAVVALRKQRSSQVAAYLRDADPQIVLEAARAIHDTPLNDAMDELAGLIATPSDVDPLVRRVLNANYRIGGADQAFALASYAATGSLVDRRLDALQMLANWAEPSSRDFLLGAWRPVDARDPAPAAAALRRHLPALLAASTSTAKQTDGGSNAQGAFVPNLNGKGKDNGKGGKPLQDAVVDAAAALGVKDIVPTLKSLVSDIREPGARRAQALLALKQIDLSQAADLAKVAYDQPTPELRAAARRVWVAANPAEGWPRLVEGAQADSLWERQDALATAATAAQGKMRNRAVELFSHELSQLIAGHGPQDTALDVVEGARAVGGLDELLAKYEQQLPTDFADKHAALLAGGSAERGRRVFFERTEVSCVRCHQVQQRGGEVGPELTHIAKEKSHAYLLESILDPNKQIAKNFESVRLRTEDGEVLTGIVKRETEEAVELMTAEGKLLRVDKDVVEARRKGLSAMPEGLAKRLTPFELRDLVEYLSTLK